MSIGELSNAKVTFVSTPDVSFSVCLVLPGLYWYIVSLQLVGGGANAAKQYWDKSVIQCGNSYFGRQKGYGIGTGFIGEFKGFKYSVDESPITESDKLNGIEWKGTTAMGCDANRVDSLFLSPWSDCRGPNGALQSAVALEKKNGRWYYHLSPFDAGIEADKYPSQLTCGEVPLAVF